MAGLVVLWPASVMRPPPYTDNDVTRTVKSDQAAVGPMRTQLLVLSLLAASLAGCISGDDLAGGSTDPTDERSEEQELEDYLADHPEFCVSEEEGGGGLGGPCDFWDEEYHQYVVYNLDTVVFDMVVLPPAGATTLEHIETSRLAAQAWEDGILEYAEPWLAEHFEINVYAVGVDIPSVDAITDPDIVVVSTAAMGLAGIGLEPKQFGCQIIGEETLEEHGGHAHGQNRIFAEDCTGVGFTCFAINGGDVDTHSLYDLIAHEIGHCLGVGHVGDALDFRARYAPVTDIMSYDFAKEQVNCVSNMNVRTLEGVLAHLLDRPEEDYLPRGSFYDMNPLEYENHDCENPPESPIVGS